MKSYQVKFEWTIRNTKTRGFRHGTSTLVLYAKNKIHAINQAITCAESMPSWEFERNNIDLQDYREGKTCTYHYETMLSKIISVETK